MNICACGCGQECKNKFIRGHNKRLAQDNVEEVELNDSAAFKYAENYTLTDVSEDVIINYEAGKKWLDATFENYSVRVLHNEEGLPYKIILSAYIFKDKQEEEKQFTVGHGGTFSNALKEILINV